MLDTGPIRVIIERTNKEMRRPAGIRPVAAAVAVLVSAYAFADLATGPAIRFQALCWATAIGALLVGLGPREPETLTALGILLIVFGVATQFVVPLRRAGMILAVSGMSFYYGGTGLRRAASRTLALIAVVLLLATHVASAQLHPAPPRRLPLTLVEFAVIALVTVRGLVVPFLNHSARYADLRREAAGALRIVAQMEREDPRAYFTQRSRLRVLEALCTYPYRSSVDLGALLHLSKKTVDIYISDWIRRTGVDNRRQLVEVFGYYFRSRAG